VGNRKSGNSVHDAPISTREGESEEGAEKGRRGGTRRERQRHEGGKSQGKTKKKPSSFLQVKGGGDGGGE